MANKRQQKIPTIERIQKMQARDIMRLSDDTLRRLSTEAYKALASRAVSLFNKRIGQIEKKGLGDYSFARERYVTGIDFMTPLDRWSACFEVILRYDISSGLRSAEAGIRIW